MAIDKLRSDRRLGVCKGGASLIGEITPVSEEHSATSNDPTQVTESVADEDGDVQSEELEGAEENARMTVSLDEEDYLWPQFFSRIRETLYLDSSSALGEQNIGCMQMSNNNDSVHSTEEAHRLHKAINSFPPRPVADFLVSVCIKHGTDNFFYFDQATFLSDIDQFYTDSRSHLRHDFRFVCLALAAFALGSQWTTLERPSEAQQSVIIQPDYGDPGKIFYSHAKTLVPDIIERPNIVTVQAIYLLGVYLMPASAISSSYIYLGLALRTALTINLHMDNSDDVTLSSTDKEIRRRLWWSIYSLERTTTLKLNRPRSISADIISAPIPSPCPSFDNVQIFDNHLHQIFYAKLALIIDRVAESTSLNMWPSVHSTGTQTSKHWYETIEAELKSWKRSLPSDFSLHLIHSRDSRYRAVFHLHLQYYYAWIAVGKVCVVAVVREHLRHHMAKEKSPLYKDQNIPSLAKHCIKAAKKLLRLFENITKTNNLTRFSFTDFQGCSISTIIVLLAGIMNRDPEYEAQVNFGLESLRKMADGNKSARTGVRFVEMLRSTADEAVVKLKQTMDQSRVQQESEREANESRYIQWAEWLVGAEHNMHGTDDSSHSMKDTSSDTRIDSTFSTVQNSSSTGTHDVGYHWQTPVSHPSMALSPSILDKDTLTAPRPRPHTKESNASLVYVPNGTGHETHQSLHTHSALEAANTSLQWLHGDDQTFLTCLTGFDMLDFADWAGPVESADG
ncbi:hypothetical protein UA08_06375 [Talaromyces atroroseus]|uniref:Xylanolytic transcriptional activator regulatory domain-containing protein n=1 Tax=Talaromyces atroroseus TaxID=1441469 RepID=A0A225AJW7_TALAT|nr:hypothetical protein UA08_06375 [Talaromyces atroroseus]OKL58584.1 hypothetical protein UA08_06375 [Talaromyces atroroseus]